MDTRLSCAPPPLHTTAEFSHSSALLLRSELVECPVRASLRAAAIERAYACSAARVVPARVGAAAVAEATRGAERPPRVSEGGGR